MSKTTAARGRPKRIDLEKTLDAVIVLLWSQGIHGISLNCIAHRIGVSKPSLANAFGGKQELIAAALRRYCARYVVALEALLSPDLRPVEACERYLYYHVKAHTDEATPRGCLFATTLSDCATSPHGPVRMALDVISNRTFMKLTTYFTGLGVSQPEALVRFLLGQALAMSALSRAGASQDELYTFARFALRAVEDFERHNGLGQ